MMRRKIRRPGHFALRVFVLLVLLLTVSLALPGHVSHWLRASAAEIAFTVNSTADTPDADLSSANQKCDVDLTTPGDQCTLRAAMQEAGIFRSVTTYRINFNIPASDANCSATTGVCTIRPTSALPRITNGVTIDGYTQPGATVNTAATGTNAQLKIELDGSLAGFSAHGLNLSANATVRGLVINRFRQNGLTTDYGSIITGNFFGTDATGTVDLGNGGSGIKLTQSLNVGITVGGTTPDARNLISGNDLHGIEFSGGTNILDIFIQGNLVGTKSDGATALGNSQHGIRMDFSGATLELRNNHIGGAAAGAGNVVAFNGRSGISLLSRGSTFFTFTSTQVRGNSIFSNVKGGVAVSGQKVHISSSSIHSNGGLGIDLDSNSVTPNDAGDVDFGANGAQNFPLLNSFTNSATETTIAGTLNSKANATFTVDFYSNSDCDPTSHGEGETPVGSISITTDAGGNASFSALISPLVLTSKLITATATDSQGNTSEFSPCLAAAPTASAVYTVNSTADTSDANLTDAVCDVDLMTAGEQCTLRAAIAQANVTSFADTINFNIAGAGVQTVNLSSSPPVVPHPVTIDGTTQPGFSGAPLIELDGSTIPSGLSRTGLRIDAGNSTVRGLIINDFDDGIELSGNGGNTIVGNLIGTDATGTTAQPNSTGILINESPNNQIGGATAATRNLISGSFGENIRIQGSRSSGNIVQGNLIGTKADGTTALTNSGDGILVESNNNQIGGAGSAGNTIAFHGNSFDSGIRIQSNGNTVQGNNIFSNSRGVVVRSTATGNSIRANSIHSNTGLGIDLNDDSAVNANDGCDADTGANNQQNFPLIGSVSSGGGQTTIGGIFKSVANQTFTLDFYRNDACDSSGNGEGKTHLGSIAVTTDAACNANFNANLAGELTGTQFITATATDVNGNTSEFSPCFRFPDPPVNFVDLAVTKTDSPDPDPVNSNLTYAVNVNNASSSDARNVVVTDTLPASVTFVSASPDCSHTSGTVTCNLGTITSNSNAMATITVRPTVTGNITNTATATTTDTDVDATNNTGTATTNVIPDVPSTHNYTFTSGTDAVLTDMTTGTAQLIAANQDNVASAVTNIGFDLFFMGSPTRYTQFSVNSNGSLRLGSSAISPTLTTPLTSGFILPVFSAFASDQATNSDGKVHFKTIGPAPNRILVVEWLNMRAAPSDASAGLTYQMRLYETSGMIEFVYGSMMMSAAGAANTIQIGFASGTTASTIGSVAAPQNGTPTYNGLATTATVTNNSFAAGAITVLHSTADNSRRVMRFVPPAPNATSGVAFTNVQKVSLTANWTDNATNENGFAIYQSTDGANFTFAATAAKNATSAVISNLEPGTNYTFRIFSVSEGALSAFAEASQMTQPAAEFVSIASGNWNAAATWNLNSVPTSGDNVTIADGHTVTLTATASAFNVTIGQGASGILQFTAGTTMTLTAGKNLTINVGASLLMQPSSTRTHTFNLRGNFANNGTLTTSAFASIIGFVGTTPQAIGGSTATAFQRLTVNNAAGVTLLNSHSINGILTFTNGNISTGANTLILAAAATVSRTSGHVVGNLKKNYSAACAKVFEVGTANGFSPVTVNVTSGTFPSAMTTRAVQGQHPALIDPTKAIARHWKLTEEGTLTATVTFNYLQADIPITATEASLILLKFASGAFTSITGTLDANANTFVANGITEFSDWTLGQPEATDRILIQGQVINPFDGVDYPLSGLTIELTGSMTASRRTDTNGRFSFLVPNSGSYTITPSASAFTFTPPSATFTAPLSGPQTANFTASSVQSLTGRIVLQNGAHIASMNADASGLLNVISQQQPPPATNPSVTANSSPVLSRDGRRIVFVRGAGNGAEIFTANADGSGLTRLTINGVVDFAPAWSFDGTKIIFVRNRGASSSDGNDLMTMNADGSNQQTLSIAGSSGAISHGSPAFSPDGTKIAFSRLLISAPTRRDLFVANDDGTSPQQLTPAAPDVFDSEAEFSPDGARIVFLRGVAATGVRDVFVMNPDGTNQTQLVTDSLPSGSPTFSPDSTKIAFLRSIADSTQRLLVVMNADGTDQVNYRRGSFAYPSWSVAPRIETPAGASVAVQFGDRTIRFPNGVTQGGTTQIVPVPPRTVGGGFQLAFEVQTTAVFTPPIQVCTIVPPSIGPALTAFNRLRLQHREGGMMVDRTSSRDFATREICATVNSLSPFALDEQIDPTLPALSGTVVDTGGAPLSGVAVTLSGTESRATDTDEQGKFFFDNLTPGGSYTVTPALEGFLFSPAGEIFPNLFDDQAVVFTGSPVTLTIGGRVTGTGGAGVGGVELTLEGSLEATTATDSGGNYSFAALPFGGSYTVTPFFGGSPLTPANRVFDSLTANEPAANFIAPPAPAPTPTPSPTPSVAINDRQVAEGNSGTTPFTFSVTLSEASSQQVTVNFNTQDSTAMDADNDYEASSGTITFMPGETSKPLPVVLVNGDTNLEPDEQFTVVLSGATNATIGDGVGTGTITNDDANSAPSFVAPADGSTINVSVGVTTDTSLSASDPDPNQDLSFSQITGFVCPGGRTEVSATHFDEFNNLISNVMQGPGPTTTATATLHLRPKGNAAGRNYCVRLRVSDNAATPLSSEITLLVDMQNTPPAWVATSAFLNEPSGADPSPVERTITLEVNDVDEGQALTFSLAGLSGTGQCIVGLDPPLPVIGFNPNPVTSGAGNESTNLRVNVGPNDAGNWCLGLMVNDGFTGVELELSVRVTAQNSNPSLAVVDEDDQIMMSEASGTQSSTQNDFALSASDFDSSQTLSFNLFTPTGGEAACSGVTAGFAGASILTDTQSPGTLPSGSTATGRLRITVGQNDAGTYCLGVRSSDGAGGTADRVVRLTITAVNDSPRATNDNYVTSENNPLNISAPGVLSNDTDPDTGQTLTAVQVSGPAHASSFTLNANGSFNYTPADGFAGTDTFTYKVRDNSGDAGTQDSNTAIVTITVNLANCAPAPAGMLLWHPADGNAHDISGNSHNGTLNGGMGFAAGKVNQAFSLNGVNQFVDLGNVTLPATFTIEAWINPNNPLAPGTVIAKDDGAGNRSYFLQIEATGSLIGSVFNGTAFTQYRTSNNPLVAGSWQHIAMTYDGSAGPDQKMKFYVNGANVPAAHISPADDGGSPQSNSLSARIGSFGDGSASFAGLIDELSVYQRVLSPTEVDSIYNASFKGKCRTCTPPANDLDRWYSGDGDADDIQSSINGTLLNGATATELGMVNQAFGLDGTDDYVEAPDSPLNSNFTIDAWVNFDAVNPTNALVGQSHGAGSNLKWIFWLNNGQLQLHLDDGLGNSPNIGNAPFVPTVGQWHHLAVTKNGDVYTFYVDGNVVGAPVVDALAFPDPFAPLTIGAAEGQFFVDGRIDEVEIFNRPLSAQEIAAIVNAGNAGKCRPANTRPHANDDGYTIAEDTTLAVNAPGVLANDTDADGHALTAQLVNGPASAASFILNPDGSFTYTPNANFSGADSFTYTASDGNGGTDTASVNITVTPVQDGPSAVDDMATVPEDSSANTVDVLANDSDADGNSLIISAVTQGAHGGVVNNGNSVSYTPALNYFGPDSFTYTISDGQGGSATATVNVTVTNVNDLSVANNDAYSTNSNTPLVVAAPGVLANDTDIDGDSLSALLVTNVSNGTLALASNGSFTYTPNPNFSGTETFTYSAFDGTANSNVATVQITVNASANKMVFSSNRDGNFEIYEMSADGTGVIRLTNNGASDLDPSLSPDRTKIAFTSTRDGNFEIYVMNANGTGVTRLTNNSAIEGFAAWSPSGAKLAFTSTRDGNSEIYVMNADGTGVTRLTNHSKIDGNPAWSPDGSKIAFTSTRLGNLEIYVMNADGTGVTRLTVHSAEDAFPSWSPDGSQIAFMSARPGNAEIYVMNANGTGVTRLTTNSAIDAEPAWNSSGKIAFTSTRDGNSEIYSMNVNGTGVMRLTNHSSLDLSPHW